MKTKFTKKFLLPFTLECIEQIQSVVSDLSFASWIRKPLYHDAVIQRLQFLGFGLRDLSKRIRARDMKRYLANKARRYDNLTKDYRKIDDRKIWDAVTLDLPRVKRKLPSLSDGK